MPSSSWPGLRANGKGWQCGGDVDSLGDKQLDDTLVLGVEDFVEGDSCLAPLPRWVDHLNEWDSACAVGTKRDASSFVGTSEISLASACIGEHTSAFRQQPGGFGAADDFCAADPLLSGELEPRRVSFRGGAPDGAAVLIEKWERHADARHQRRRSCTPFCPQGDSELTDQARAFGRHSRACPGNSLPRGANVRSRSARSIRRWHVGERERGIKRGHDKWRVRLLIEEDRQVGSRSGEISLLHPCLDVGAVAFQLRANEVSFRRDTLFYASAVVRDHRIEPRLEVARYLEGNLRASRSVERARGIHADTLTLGLWLSLGSPDIGVCPTHSGPALVQRFQWEHGRYHRLAVHGRSCSPGQRRILHVVHEYRVSQGTGRRARASGGSDSRVCCRE